MPLRSRDRPVNVVVIPNVAGGLGHVTRTVKLARGLERADPTLAISYVLDEHRLRPFNVEAVERLGYPVRILPDRARPERDEAVRAVLGEADVIVEDTVRRLIPFRRILPRLKAWVSIPMLPLWDDLFMDWPLFEQVDHILYSYPPSLPFMDELEPFRPKLSVTGPILDVREPDRAAGLGHLGLSDGDRYIFYSPRGFPFGRPFGRRVLNGLVGGFLRLRARRPDLHLHLVLSAVADPEAIQTRQLPPLDRIDGVILQGIVSPEVVFDCLGGAGVAVLEGTSTLFDAAIARAPVLMVPGWIHETRLLGSWVEARDAGLVIQMPQVTPTSMARILDQALEPEAAAARADRLHELVGTDGGHKAVQAVLGVIRDKVPA